MKLKKIPLNFSFLKNKKTLLSGLVLLIALVSIYFIYVASLTNQENARAKALSVFSQYTNAWLKDEQKLHNTLLDDPRLAGTNQDTLSVESRKALYEFRYAQNLKDIYLFDTRNGNVMRAPSTLPLPTNIKNFLSPEKSAPFHALLATINNSPFFLSAQRLNYPESREPIYSIIAQPINAALNKLTSLQPSIKNHKLGLIYKGSSHQYIPFIHKRRPSMFTTPQDLYTDVTNPIHRTEKLQGDKMFITTASLEKYPQWQITISTNHIKPPYKAIALILLFSIIATLVIWFYKPVLSKIRILLQNLSNKPKPMPTYDYKSFTPASQPTSHELGRSTSTAEYIPTPSPQKRRKKLVNPTSTNFKIWDNVQDSLKKDEAILHYQPIKNLSSHKVEMHEVFLRVLDKNKKQIQPATFLPAMEHYHAAGKIDTYVLDKVLNTHFPDGKNQHNSIFNINLTGQAFDAMDFLSTMMEKMPEEVLPYIAFELRHYEIKNDSSARKFLTECSDMGLRMAVDYFGGGKNMLQIAKKIGFSWVKVTKEALNKEGISIKELAEASQEVGIELILERIETAEELKEAQDYGIKFVQGYFIGKPQEWADLENA